IGREEKEMDCQQGAAAEEQSQWRQRVAELESIAVEYELLQQRYQALFENAPVMYVITRNQWGMPIIEDCNLLFLRTLDYTRKEVIGHSLFDFHTSESYTDLWNREMYQRALQGDKISGECQLRGRSGRVIETLLYAVPEVDNTGNRVGVQVLFVDITRQKRQELQRMALYWVREEMRKMRNEADIQHVLATVRSSMKMLDVPFMDCGINTVDISQEPPKACFHNLTDTGEWLPIGSERGKQVIIQLWQEKKVAYRRDLDQEDPYGEQSYIAQVFEHPVRAVLDVPFSHGTLAVNSSKPNAFSEEDVKFLQCLGDILSESFQRLDEIKMMRANEEQLQQLQRLEAIARLAGGVAHDFNNLLTIISGYCQLFRKKFAPDHPGYAEMYEVEKAAERGTSLVRQLLTFSRRQHLQREVLSLNTVITEIEKMLRRLIGEDIELTFELDPELKKIYADSGQIEQVIMNLIVNARDAMPQGGKITLKTAHTILSNPQTVEYADLVSGDYVMLEVMDTGMGMDAETQAHIFEPFFTTKEVGKGTGLGLATVYGIVKQSKGFIRINSAPGQGATFRIYLPQAAEETNRIAQHREVRPDSLQGTETILVVEDDTSLQKIVTHLLHHYGYTTLTATHGKEAIQTSAQYKGVIHLLLTDIVMPGINGYKLAKKLFSVRPEMKVLYMSGYSEDEIEEREISTIKTKIVRKPFVPETLVAKVREVLER
ncbi:MAG: ATP-binding protein, partial [bacterium]